MKYDMDPQLRKFDLLVSGIDAVYHDAALKLGISDSAMLILYTLCANGGECLLGDITASVSKQTVNSALRKLEADRIVRSELYEGRKKKLYFTEKGRQFADRTILRLIRIENEVFGRWTEEERAVYIELTRRYLTDFREKIKEL